ncbi:hypothetical protein RitSun_54 [Mycobacterium phage RitSun]|nr:hypothetical protein RitSun_54 [Mycobacterium phage RitSun]
MYEVNGVVYVRRVNTSREFELKSAVDVGTLPKTKYDNPGASVEDYKK